MSINKELLKGSVATMALKILQRKAMYGYELIKEIQSRSEGALELKEGTLYPVLHSLEQQKLLESFWEESDSQRKRKYYRITKAGREALKEREGEWKTFRAAIDKILSGARWGVEYGS